LAGEGAGLLDGWRRLGDRLGLREGGDIVGSGWRGVAVVYM
jgi:hypothetical protein